MPFLLALDVLVRTERHALARARDEERVRDGEERKVLREREIVRVQEHDRLVGQGAESTVDSRDDVGDGGLRFILLRRLKCNLDEDDL